MLYASPSSKDPVTISLSSFVPMSSPRDSSIGLSDKKITTSQKPTGFLVAAPLLYTV